MSRPIRYDDAVLGSDYAQQDCSIARSLEVFGERWTLLIVRDAFYGVRRFNDFRDHLDIPKAVLSDRLSGLVEHGILTRTSDPRHAGRHLYELTASGRALWPVLHAMLVWGDRHRQRNGRAFRHAVCGTELGEAGGCTTCGLTPGPEEVVTAPRRGRRARRTDRVAVALRAPHRLLTPLEV